LGAYSAKLAYCHSGSVEIIPNREGQSHTPCAVWLNPRGRIVVGQRAMEALPTDPANVVTHFSHSLGTNKEYTFARTGQRITPEDLSAEVLRSLRTDAEHHTSLEVAYVWHASKFTREVLDGLLRIGFLHHQQIIWNKGRTVLTRTHYWFQHEPAWYVRKKNAPWFGKAGENSTIWDSPSPKFIMGGSDEDKYDHPTQKPVELMRRPILNHLRRGELVYEPFLGSGTTLAAAELTERVCYGIELDPKYVDVVIQRWQQLTGKQATLDGDGRTFDDIAQERGGSRQAVADIPTNPLPHPPKGNDDDR
jgi:hypothetical protein